MLNGAILGMCDSESNADMILRGTEQFLTNSALSLMDVIQTSAVCYLKVFVTPMGKTFIRCLLRKG